MENSLVGQKNQLKRRSCGGYFLPLVLAFAGVAFVVSGAIISLVFQQLHTIKSHGRSASALNIAEAGVNYYLWHLSHNNQDYCDGQACSGEGPYGPFLHEYQDANGQVVGNYELTITPPPSGSNVVTVRSVGSGLNEEKRTVVARLAVPSFAQYSFLTNTEAWFGDNETTHGLVHSNQGIHFDGVADGVVSSATATYVPSYCFGGDGQTHPGVWGDGGPASSWSYPVPQVDFNQITSDLGELSQTAQDGGIYLSTLVDNRGRKTHGGYAIQLNADGTLRVGKVTDRLDSGGSGGCASHSRERSLIQSVSWEPNNRTLPGNGVIFVADNLWVWGTVTSRLTIATGRLPDNASTNTNIYLQNNINYSTKDGTVALGLIAQKDIIVNSDSVNNLNLDAYLLAQKGKVFRPYYPNNVKDNISIYGGVSSGSWWTWSWVSDSTTVSGYRNTSHTYDTHLAFDPPPLFPETGSFAILSWQEEPVF